MIQITSPNSLGFTSLVGLAGPQQQEPITFASGIPSLRLHMQLMAPCF
jgi:hypothetical protein